VQVITLRQSVVAAAAPATQLPAAAIAATVTRAGSGTVNKIYALTMTAGTYGGTFSLTVTAATGAAQGLGVVDANISAEDFAALLATQTVIASTDNVSVQRVGTVLNVEFVGTQGLSNVPVIAVTNIDLLAPKGVSGTINFNTIPLNRAFWNTTETELTYRFAVRRTRATGEEREFYNASVTLKRNLIDASTMVAVFTGGITIGTTGIIGGTSGRVLYDNAGVVGEYAISGTGDVAMTGDPVFTNLITTPYIYCTAEIQFGASANGFSYVDDPEHNIITVTAPAGAFGTDKVITLPNATGTVALTSDITGGTLAGSFTTLAVNGKSLTLGASLTTTGTDLPTFAFPSAAAARTYTFPTTTATLARTDAAQTFSGTQTIQAATNAGVPLIAKSFTAADGSTGNIQQWQKSDGTVVARIYGGTGTFSAGAIEAGGMVFGNTNEFWQNSTNSTDGIYFNYRGYIGGSAQFRDTYFADGKNTVFLSLTGSTKSFALSGGGPASFSGTLAVTGASTLTGVVTFSAVPRFNGTNTTGAGTALLGTNSPAVTNTAPFTWFQVTTSDGSTGYIPVWK